jgi:hypothetical protein
MKTSTYNILKKIENADGKIGATDSPTPKKGGGKKRKASPVGGEDDEEATPVSKKKGRKSKKMAETPAETAADCKLLSWSAHEQRTQPTADFA